MNPRRTLRSKPRLNLKKISGKLLWRNVSGNSRKIRSPLKNSEEIASFTAEKISEKNKKKKTGYRISRKIKTLQGIIGGIQNPLGIRGKLKEKTLVQLKENRRKNSKRNSWTNSGWYPRKHSERNVSKIFERNLWRNLG